MLDKVLLAVFVAALLYFGYLIVQNKLFSEGFEVPARAPPVFVDPPADIPRTISPGGSSTPNQAAPPTGRMVERLPGPDDNDPYDESYGSSQIKDNLRYPERFYGPAPQPTNTAIALESGVAGLETSQVAPAIQTFSPELAQNGGQFIDGGVFANDTTGNPNYSAI